MGTQEMVSAGEASPAESRGGFSADWINRTEISRLLARNMELRMALAYIQGYTSEGTSDRERVAHQTASAALKAEEIMDRTS